LFDELGKLYDKELKHLMTGSNKKDHQARKKHAAVVERLLLVDDHEIGALPKDV